MTKESLNRGGGTIAATSWWLVKLATGDWSQRNKTSQFPALQHITLIIAVAVAVAEWQQW